MTSPSSRKTTKKVEVVQVPATEVEELRTAVISLSTRVGSLSEALNTVNEIQERQNIADLERVSIQAEAKEAKETVRVVEETMLPREEHEARWRAEQQSLIRLRKAIRRKTYVVGTTFFLLSLLALGITTGLVTENQHQQHLITKQGCQQRTESSRQAVTAYQHILNSSTTIKHDGDLKAFITAARDAALRQSKVKC